MCIYMCVCTEQYIVITYWTCNHIHNDAEGIQVFIVCILSPGEGSVQQNSAHNSCGHRPALHSPAHHLCPVDGPRPVLHSSLSRHSLIQQRHWLWQELRSHRALLPHWGVCHLYLKPKHTHTYTNTHWLLTANFLSPKQIPRQDPRFGRNSEECIPFFRSAPSCGSGNTGHLFGAATVRQQMNTLTAFIDAGQVYGSDEAKARLLRDLSSDKGLLRVNTEFTDNGRELLPFEMKSTNMCATRARITRNNNAQEVPCFLGGKGWLAVSVL